MVSKKIIMARILFAIYLIAVGMLCFMHFDSLPDVQKNLWGIPTDKVVHFFMFLPFPILCYLSYDHKTNTFWSAVIYALITLAIGVGIAYLTELGQKYLPYRTMDMKDLVADVLALTASTILVFLIDITHLSQNK